VPVTRPLDRYQEFPEDAEPCVNCGEPIDDAGTEPWCAKCYDDDPLTPAPCACREKCGDDGDTEGPGICKGLPMPPRVPLVEVVLIRRDTASRS